MPGFERIFLDYGMLNVQGAGRGQLLSSYFAKWKSGTVEILILTTEQVEAAKSGLSSAGLMQYVEEVHSITQPTAYASKGACLFASLKSPAGWVPREQILVDVNTNDLRSIWLDEAGAYRRCTLSSTMRFQGDQVIDGNHLDQLDKILFGPSTKVTRHFNMFTFDGKAILDEWDSAYKIKLDTLPEATRKEMLKDTDKKGDQQAYLAECIKARPDLAKLIGMAAWMPKDDDEEVPASLASHVPPPATKSGVTKRASLKQPVQPVKPMKDKKKDESSNKAALVRSFTLQEYAVEIGARILVQGGSGDGKIGVVERITGDPGSKRFKVKLEDEDTTTWAPKVRGIKDDGGAEAVPIERGAVVSPLMAALNGGAPAGGKGGGRGPPPARRASAEPEEFPEGVVVEVTKGIQKGKIGKVVKIQGDKKEKKWRVQIEAGGPCSWVEGVKSTDKQFTEAPKVVLITDLYDVEKKKLGSGAYGSVTKVMNKATGLTRAMKTIPRPMVKDVAQIWREVAFMKQLDHPNIIKIYDTFEDARNVYLVMELCLGGELFDRIIDAGFFTEVQAAVVMQHAMRGVYYMHSKKVVHRDLKPENFLLTTKEAVDKANLKVIDFGLAHDFPEPGTFLRTKTGSAYYVAPQVLMGEYDEGCDMWSFGVIMYTLLCGYPPFQGETDPEIMKQVKEGKYDFPPAEWSSISSDAKELIKNLMHFDPKGRYNAQKSLTHPWIQQRAPKAKPGRQGSIVANLKSFVSQNKIKKAVLQVIANQMSEDQIKALRDTFQAMDDNGDGLLSVQELKDGVSKIGLTDIPADLESIIDNVDANASGMIDYTEFLAATLDKKLYEEKSLCWAAFRVFDKNGDGKLSKEEVEQVLQDTNVKAIAKGELTDIMKSLDANGDGELDFEEFMAMVRN